MRRRGTDLRLARVSVIVVSVTLLCTLASLQPASAAPGDEAWAERFDLEGLEDAGFAVVADSDGSRVFVGGWATSATTGNDFLTIAADAATGQTLWTRRFRGPGRDTILGVALRPNDGLLFVTGTSEAPNGQTHIRTIAYETPSGHVRWMRKFHDVVGNPAAIAVSPDGGTVVVAGGSVGALGRDQMVTIAYRAATGAQEWVRRYDGAGDRPDTGVSLAVGAGSARVFVTGIRDGAGDQHDYLTIAYRISDGSPAWMRTYDGPASGKDEPRGLALSSDGSTVFVTGRSRAATHDYATVAYRAGSGRRLWVRRYDGPAGDDLALDVVATADAVFVTGSSEGVSSGGDVATIAYDADTGMRLWVERFDGPDGGDDAGVAIAASSDEAEVFVAGSDLAAGSTDFATIAYAADDGQPLWDAHYQGPAGVTDFAIDVAVDPLGARVFVTGSSWTGPTSATSDAATIAYLA